MMTLALHEGNPGHHLQGSFAIDMSNVPKFRQMMEDRRWAHHLFCIASFL